VGIGKKVNGTSAKLESFDNMRGFPSRRHCGWKIFKTKFTNEQKV
jgi:hypothetical protein